MMRAHDVKMTIVLTSNVVASTLIRRHFGTKCPLGTVFIWSTLQFEKEMELIIARVLSQCIVVASDRNRFSTMFFFFSDFCTENYPLIFHYENVIFK